MTVILFVFANGVISLIPVFCSLHHLFIHRVRCIRFFATIVLFFALFFFSVFFSIFVKEDLFTQNLHYPAFTCIVTVVLVCYVSACNEGGMWWTLSTEGVPYRQESLSSSPEGSLDRSATDAWSLRRSTLVLELFDRYRPTP